MHTIDLIHILKDGCNSVWVHIHVYQKNSMLKFQSKYSKSINVLMKKIILYIWRQLMSRGNIFLVVLIIRRASLYYTKSENQF